MPHVLPPDWQDVVRRVSGWLDDATAKLDRHEAEFRLRFPTQPAAAPHEFAALTERLRELPKKLEPLEAAAASAEASTREVETSLRDMTRRSETLRRRLAEGVGRAIG